MITLFQRKEKDIQKDIVQVKNPHKNKESQEMILKFQNLLKVDLFQDQDQTADKDIEEGEIPLIILVHPLVHSKEIEEEFNKD